MSITTYKLVLVGPSWGSTATEAAALPSWPHLDDDDHSADLTGLCTLLDAGDDAAATETGYSPAERARLLLEELEKEDNTLEDALQESFLPADGLPVFGEITLIAPVAEAETPAVVLNCLTASVDTEALLRDLEAMLPEVTPPLSPPIEEQTAFSDIDELLFLRSLSLPDPEPYLPPTPSTLSNHSSPVASPYSSPAMSSPYHIPSTPSSQLSPYYTPSTPVSQPSSSPYHIPSTPSSASWDSDSTTDPDWMDDAPGPSRGRSAAARPKPYSRPTGKARKPEDRRERKKVQNKNAATRYRLKKKAEDDELMSQEDGLAETNEELKSKVADLSNEIRIIKGLLRDQCKRLGIIKN